MSSSPWVEEEVVAGGDGESSNLFQATNQFLTLLQSHLHS